MAYRSNAAILRDYAGTDLVGTALLTDTKKLTSAQLLALFTTPVQIVAPSLYQGDTGVGIVFSHAVFHKPAGTAYVGANALTIRYTGIADPVLCTMASADLLNQAGAVTRIGSTLDADHPVVANTGIEVFMGTANPTAGTSALYIQVYYYLTPLNLAARF